MTGIQHSHLRDARQRVTAAHEAVRAAKAELINADLMPNVVEELEAMCTDLLGIHMTLMAAAAPRPSVADLRRQN